MPHAGELGVVVEVVRLALLSGGGSSRDGDPLAPSRVAPPVALQVAPRIANELRLKLGIRVSPRTVGKYIPKRPPGHHRRAGQRWATFLRNHAKAILACDFFVTVTATFRLLYVFVLIHHGSRRLLHSNVTAHPTATWTLQQLREAIGFGQDFRYLLHDRDSILARNLDESIEGFGLRVLKSPRQRPMANALCERPIGTIRRECLDWMTGCIMSIHSRPRSRDGYLRNTGVERESHRKIRRLGVHFPYDFFG